MKSATSVLKFYYHLKLALFYAKDFLLEHPTTVFEKLFKTYIDKINWIHTNTITSIVNILLAAVFCQHIT